MPVALGLDLGTTSVSVIAVDETGRVLAARSEPHRADVEGLPSGRAEQDPLVIRAVAVRLLAEVADELATPPSSLGVSGQMHGMLLVDAERRPLSNLITWQDRRANEPADPAQPEGPTHLDRMHAAIDDLDEATANTGTRPAPGFLGVTLGVLSAHGNVPTEARWAVCLADWLVAEACETTPVTAASHAASTGLYDVRQDEWSAGLVRALGVNDTLLPEVRAADSIVGTPGTSFADACRLPRGLPVANAIGDHQASILGSVPAGEPALHVNLGTGGQIDWEVPAFVRIDGMDTRPLPVGRRMLVGAGLAGGDAFAWVGRTVADWLDAFGLSVDDDSIYARLLDLAETATPSSLRVTPTFRGTRTNPCATGSFTGVTNDNFGLGDLTRAVLQGIVDGFHAFVERAGLHAPAATRIIGTGNALDRNPLLVRLLEERFDLEVWRPRHPEAAAFGAALLGGTATGIWPTFEAAGSTIELARSL